LEKERGRANSSEARVSQLLGIAKFDAEQALMSERRRVAEKEG